VYAFENCFKNQNFASHQNTVYGSSYFLSYINKKNFPV